jgi:hypothetical protein
MFGDSDGSKDASAGAPRSASPDQKPFPNWELTLSSYLYDKPPLASAAATAPPGPSSPPNPTAAAADEATAAAAKLYVERDFLHISAPKRGDSPGDDSSVVGGKKPRLDSLQLSLSLSNDTPVPPLSSSQPPSHLAALLPADVDLRNGSDAAELRPYELYNDFTRGDCDKEVQQQGVVMPATCSPKVSSPSAFVPVGDILESESAK